MTAESQQMYMAINRKEPQRKVAGAGYVSSSIFKPTSSENSDPDANYMKYENLYEDYDMNGRRSIGQPYASKNIKLKQLRLKQKEEQKLDKKSIMQLWKGGQSKNNAPNTVPYKKSYAGLGGSLPPVDKTDTLSNTPRRQNIRVIPRDHHRLSTGNLHLTQSPPLSTIEGYPGQQRGSLPHMILNEVPLPRQRPPSWGGGPTQSSIRNQKKRSNDNRVQPSFQKSLPNSLKSLPVLKVLGSGLSQNRQNYLNSDQRPKDGMIQRSYDQSNNFYVDMPVGNRTPSSQLYSNSKKFLIDQSTLPNRNLSQSEINKINDLHNMALNRQLKRQKLQLSQQMINDGITFQDTNSTSVQIKKPPLNQMAMKRPRRRQIRNSENLGQQPYGQAAYILPTLNKTMNGPLGGTSLNEEQQLSSLPYAFVPVDQPIMMVNYSTGTPILQPVRYRSYGELPDTGAMIGPNAASDQIPKFEDTASSVDENVYYQLVGSTVRQQGNYPQQTTKATYKRHLNAIENWSWLTQRLVEMEQTKVERRLRGPRQRFQYESEQQVMGAQVTSESESAGFQRQRRAADTRRMAALRERKVLRRWEKLVRPLIVSMRSGSWADLKHSKGRKLQIHVNLEGIRAEEAAMDRWKRVLFRLMQESGQYQLNLLKEPEMILEGLVWQKKQQKIKVYWRWNQLIRKSLQRIASMQAQNNLRNWIRLVKRAETKGYLNLRGGIQRAGQKGRKPDLAEAAQLTLAKRQRAVKSRALQVNARWFRLTKLLLKNSKSNSMVVCGKWRQLVTKMLARAPTSRVYDQRTRSLRLCAKWRKLATILLNKAQKKRSMKALGKWRSIIDRLVQSNAPSRKLQINARWRKLAIKILSKDTKTTQLRAIGNWRVLFNSLKRYEYEIFRERRGRKLQVCAKWAKLARKLLQQQGRRAKLQTIGRWNTLIKGLKTLEYKELRKTRQQSLATTGRLYRLARKLLQRENKMQSLRIIGRWRTLYLGLKQYEFHDLKQQKMNRLRIFGKWRRLSNAILKRDARKQSRQANSQIQRRLPRAPRHEEMSDERRKIKSMTNIGKWSRLAGMLLDKQQDRAAVRVQNRWKILLRKLASRRANSLSLASIKTMKVGEQIRRLEGHQSRSDQLAIFGRWSRMARAALQIYNAQQAQDEKLQRLLVLGRWRGLSKKVCRKHDVQERWAKIVRRLHQKRGSHFTLNLLKRIQKNNQGRREKKAKLLISAKWSMLTRMLLRKQGRAEAGISPAINLRRMAIKLLKREQRRGVEQRWRVVAMKALQLTRKQQCGQVFYEAGRARPVARAQGNFEVICKWGKLSRKLMKKHDGRGSMEARVNLARLARKLINRYKNGSSRQSHHLGTVQLSMKNRQDKAHRRLRNLTMKLIVHDSKKTSRKAQFNLARMARLLVQKRTGKMMRDRTDPWKNMYLQLHQHKIAAVLARHDKRPHKRTSHLGIIERWELLTAYLVTQKKHQRTLKYQKKWRSMMVKMMALNNFYR